MENYNFWQDFFDTYQSLSDWIKALWLVVPPTFVIGLVALTMRVRSTSKLTRHGALIYSIYRDDDDQMHIVSHIQQMETKQAMLLLDPPVLAPPPERNLGASRL